VGGTVIGTLSAQPQCVVAALDSGVVKAYSGTGRLLGSHFVRQGLCPYVTQSHQGITFVGGLDGTLIAINRSGRGLWKANLGGVLSAPIVTGWDGRVFAAAAGKIFCYTASGTPLWAVELGSKISAGPVLDQDGYIELALENNQLVQINPFGFAQYWRLPAAPSILVPIENYILAFYSNGSIMRVDSSVEGSAPLPLPGLSSMPLAAAGSGGWAAVFLADGQVALLAGNNGRVLWSGGSSLRPLADEKADIIFDKRGIYALCPRGAASFTVDGKRLWSANLENTAGVPAFGDDGILYSGGKDWVLNAWKLEERTLRQKLTLYGPAPEASYGTGNPPPSMYVNVIGRYNETTVRRELDMIQKGIASGRVGGNELDWLAYLMETADGGYRPGISKIREPKAVINQRIQALQLLSRLGSAENIPWLISFFRRENELMIKIAAVKAIGGIGMDPDGKAIQEFTAIVRNSNPAENEQLFIAIASATGSLCRFSGYPLYDIGFQLLDLLNNPTQLPSIRRQAKIELDSLK
jgi:outer membrane protein assembly factor BamB